jgi:propionyl-CoA carboxylase beta chain
MDEITQKKREHFVTLQEESILGGGQKRIDKQHSQGKLTARERIEQLVDPNSFREFDQFVTHNCHHFGMEEQSYLGDGVITGLATINGKKVALFSQDFTCWGGALGHAYAQKICKVMDFALDNLIPVIGINDSGGARIQEGVESLAGYADIFHRNVKASGVIPQISIILGPCAGGAVYSPAMTDFIFMVEKTSYMFVTGPEVIKTVTHEEVTKEDLGGAANHSEKSGVSHFKCSDEPDCFERVRELMYFLPSSNKHKVRPGRRDEDIDRPINSLKDFVPANPKKPYDMREFILSTVDKGHFLEVQKDYAQNIVCGFAAIGGIKIAIIANQPQYLAGVLDIDSSTKAARFVRFADAFNLPILTLVDVPGFLPGTVQEYGGIIRHGAKLLYAFSEASVPMVTLITRKAYGGAYDVMASKHIGADINLAFPSAEIAVMGAEGAVNIIFRNDLKGLEGEQLQAKHKELVDKYQDEFANPYTAAKKGYIDEIILPEHTRSKLYESFWFLRNKKINRPERKHGNIPL